MKKCLELRLIAVEQLLENLSVAEGVISTVKDARYLAYKMINLLQDIMNMPGRATETPEEMASTLAAIHVKAYETWKALRLGTGAPFPPAEPIVIEVRGGVVVDVRNLPPGVEYRLIDHDNDEANHDTQ